MKRKVDGVLIDFDGVISRNSPGIVLSCFHEALNDLAPISIDYVRNFFRIAGSFPVSVSVDYLLKSLGLESSVQIFYKKLSEKKREKLASFKIEKDFYEFIEFCKQNEIQYKIFSLGDEEHLSGLKMKKEDFYHLQGGSKADIKTFQHAVNELKMHNVVYIDDSPLGLRTGKLNGMTTILCKNDLFTEEDHFMFRDYIDYKVESFSEIQKIIANLNLNVGNDDLLTILQEKIYYSLSDPKSDFSSIKSYLSDNISWIVEGVQDVVPFAGKFSGIEGVEKFFDKYKKSVKDLQYTVRYHVADNLSVNYHLIEEGTILETNKPYRMETMNVWKFDSNKKIIAYRNYNDTNAMFHAFNPDSDPSLSISKYTADYHLYPIGRLGPRRTPTINPESVVQNWYSALRGQGNILDVIDKDVIFILPGAKYVTPFAGEYKGLDQFLYFLTLLSKTERIEDFTINPEDKKFVISNFIVDDEMLERSLVFSTGKEFNIKGAHSIIISNEGKIQAWRSYNDTYEIAKAFM